MERWNAAIVVFDGVEVLDFAGPYEVFSRTRLTPGLESRRSEESAPFRVFTVAPRPGPVTATGGLRLIPDHDVASAPRIDLLVIPGGFGTRLLAADPAFLEWVRTTAGTARKVASVCTGALVLARAGLLENRRATTHWALLDELEGMGAGVLVERGCRFVDDGVVTSAGVAAGIDMALHLVEELFGREVAEETARYIEYRRPRTP